MNFKYGVNLPLVNRECPWFTSPKEAEVWETVLWASGQAVLKQGWEWRGCCWHRCCDYRPAEQLGKQIRVHGVEQREFSTLCTSLLSFIMDKNRCGASVIPNHLRNLSRKIVTFGAYKD